MVLTVCSHCAGVGVTNLRDLILPVFRANHFPLPRKNNRVSYFIFWLLCCLHCFVYRKFHRNTILLSSSEASFLCSKHVKELVKIMKSSVVLLCFSVGRNHR